MEEERFITSIINLGNYFVPEDRTRVPHSNLTAEDRTHIDLPHSNVIISSDNRVKQRITRPTSGKMITNRPILSVYKLHVVLKKWQEENYA